MNPQELLSNCLQEASSLLRSSDRVSHRNLRGLSTEDIAQESVIKILLSPSFPEVNKSYIATTVKSVCSDAGKKQEIPLESYPSIPENTEEFFELMTLEDIAEDVLKHLQGGQKELFTAIYIDGISLDSLSTHYGLTTRSINRKLYELRITVEELLSLH